MAGNGFCVGALDGASIFFKPDDGAGGATLRGGGAGQRVLGVIDDSQIVDDLDEAAGGVSGTAAAGGAGYFAFSFCLLAIGEAAAGDPQLVACGVDREELFGTDVYAIAACGA